MYTISYFLSCSSVLSRDDIQFRGGVSALVLFGTSNVVYRSHGVALVNLRDMTTSLARVLGDEGSCYITSLSPGRTSFGDGVKFCDHVKKGRLKEHTE
jgi:hypothetical protein